MVMAGEGIVRFEYLRPNTVEEAVSLLCRYNSRARVIAGSTDLVVQMRAEVEEEPWLKPQCLIDIEGIPGLNYVYYDVTQGLKIGALTTIRTLEKSAQLHQGYPVISRAASQLGSVAVRNIATLGGNLCNAAPSAEMAPALIGLSARARIVGPDGERLVGIEDFFTGPGETVLRTGELLVEIQVPVPLPGTMGVYLKCGKRWGTVDLAIVGVAVVVTVGADGETCQNVRIALGAVAPTPMRATRAEKVVKGSKITDEIINMSAQAASDEARPIADVRATAEYRKEMVKVYTRRAIKLATGK
jgi:carbon-monoxide dehydrogenase medium subunit